MLNALDRGKVLWQASVNDGEVRPVDMVKSIILIGIMILIIQF
jgi:hypothetical protein